jgi:hypothetical protein
MLSIQEVYALCQPLTDAYITFSYEEIDITECGKKHLSAYFPKYDCISINKKQVEDQSAYHNIPIPRMLFYILIHEIGHSLDPNICTEEDEYILEKTAWDIADYLMGELKLPKTKEYFRVRNWALSNYMRKE